MNQGAQGEKKSFPVWLIVLIIVGMCFLTIPVVAIVAAIAIPNLIEARQHGNEAAAIGAMKTLIVAQALFREGDKEGDELFDYGSLRELSDTTLVDGVLGSGTKQGYLFECAPSSTSGEFLWFATATPIVPGTTGDRFFVVNNEGVVYYRSDPKTEAPIPMNTTDCKIPEGLLPVGR